MTIGWGQMENGTESDELKRLPRTLLRNEVCRNSFEYSNDFVDKIMYCTSTAGKRDQCQGDSGSGWFTVDRRHRNGESKWHLIGLTSWGQGCGGHVGVGARLNDENLNWIKTIVSSNT